MYLFNIVLALAVLGSISSCAPAKPTNGAHNISGDPTLPPRSPEIAHRLWYSNTTVVRYNNTGLSRILTANINACGESSFENRVSKASPLVEDCLHLHDDIAGVGMWTVALYEQHRLAQYGTCAFGVDGHGGYGSKASTFQVGNEDIRDLIADSVSLFQWDDDGIGRVGTRGFMPCEPEGILVEWGIYHI